jgi:hypothetical protein
MGPNAVASLRLSFAVTPSGNQRALCAAPRQRDEQYRAVERW